jgi:hypothetical protein
MTVSVICILIIYFVNFALVSIILINIHLFYCIDKQYIYIVVSNVIIFNLLYQCADVANRCVYVLCVQVVIIMTLSQY